MVIIQTWHGLPVPWLPVRRPWLSWVCRHMAPHYHPEQMPGHGTVHWLLEGRLGLCSHDHLVMWVGRPEGHWHHSSSHHWVAVCFQWHWIATVQPPTAHTGESSACKPAGHMQAPDLRPHPGGCAYIQKPKDQVSWLTNYLQIHRGVQGGRHTTQGHGSHVYTCRQKQSALSYLHPFSHVVGQHPPLSDTRTRQYPSLPAFYTNRLRFTINTIRYISMACNKEYFMVCGKRIPQRFIELHHFKVNKIVNTFNKHWFNISLA